MLVSEVIEAAYREANIVVIGELPTADEYAEALSRLNDYREKLFGSEFGENLDDWPVPPVSNPSQPPEDLVSPNLGSTWYQVPRTNSRLLTKLTAATTVMFPESPNDGSRMYLVDVGSTAIDLKLDGNGRLIDGQAYLLDTPLAFNGKQWFYRADLASWEQVRNLGLNDSLPLPREYNDLFICYLAIRMSPRHSRKVADDTRALYSMLTKQAKARYRQSQAVAISDRGISESQQSFNENMDWFG